MEIDASLVQRLAKLSKLHIDKASEKQLIQDFKAVFKLVDKLNEVDTTGVEPLVYLNDETNVMRQDNPCVLNKKADILQNAPLADSDFIKVPKVL